MEMRTGAERPMSCVVQTPGAGRAHHSYLLANVRTKLFKLRVHDGIGALCASRQLNAGHSAWPRETASAPLDATPVRRLDRRPATPLGQDLGDTRLN
jgi:hypothetical protein